MQKLLGGFLLLVVVGGILGYAPFIPTSALKSGAAVGTVVIALYIGVLLVRPEVRRSSSGFWVPALCIAGLLCFIIPMWVARSFLS